MTVRPREAAIARLAARQHGVVALWQLVELGLSDSAVRSRVATDRLHRIHVGVYAVGHSRLTTKRRWMAAVLACGPGAVLSHRAAAAHLGIRRSASSRIEITAPRRRRIAGIHAYANELAAAT